MYMYLYICLDYIIFSLVLQYALRNDFLQGDIIEILDKNGNCVVEYTYDSWGKVLSIDGSMKNSLGSHNPIRYRGYYYDRESGFYYLKSRYYDPNTGKFLNADSASMLVSGEKAYTYCENNPVNYNDANGNSFLKVYIEGWDDTLLHLGLSTDGISLIDLFGAMHYYTLSRNLNDNGDEVEDEDEKTIFRIIVIQIFLNQDTMII